MRRLFLPLYVALFIPVILPAQNTQVTDVRGQLSLDPPVLNIRNGVARITHGTNFYFYTFPSSGPAAPITNPVKPDSNAWGPITVSMIGDDAGTGIAYIDYVPSRTGYDVRWTTSTDGGAHWTIPSLIGGAADGSTITLYPDNLILASSAKGNRYCIWRNQADTNRMSMAFPNGPFGPFLSKRLPIGDTTNSASVVSLATRTVSGTDNLFLVFSTDSSLYFIRSTDEGQTFSSPVPIATYGGIMGYFSVSSLLSSATGQLYAAYSYWSMASHQPGVEPNSAMGTVLITSTNDGSSWNLVDTLFHDMGGMYSLQLTPGGTLVMTQAESSNVYLRSSLNGKDWSARIRVNPMEGTATGKYNFGFSLAIVDDGHAGVAWIDTSTGYDEIHYRLMGIPAAPVTGVSETPAALPAGIVLHPAYPNPFNPATTIRYTIASTASISLTVYDLLGREIATLAEGVHAAGTYAVTWNPASAASGVYYCRLQSGARAAQQKLILMR